MARAMVTRFGMSDVLGPLVYGRKEELVFLGKEIGEQRDYSDAIAHQIDDEVHKIVMQAYDRARQVILDRRAELDRVVHHLMERETLSAEEFAAAFEGTPLPKRKEKPPTMPPQTEVEPVLTPSPAAA